MKNLLMISLIILGSMATSCKKNYSCVTTIYTIDTENTFCKTHASIEVKNVTKKELETYKNKEFNTYSNYNGVPQNVDVVCEEIK